MTEPITLYFDQVDSDGSRGITSNGEKVLYNLKQISDDYFNQYTDALTTHNKSTIFIPTGRFMSDIRATLDDNEKSMATFDLQNNLSLAERVAPKESPYFEAFMKAFTLIEPNYQPEYNKFILVVGDVPQNQADNNENDTAES